MRLEDLKVRGQTPREANNPLDVVIGLDQSVGDLKEAIHREKTYRFPADKLQLFLAKKKSGKWLTEDEAAAVRDVPKSFKPMKTTSYLKNCENFGWNFQSGENQIHILVVLPMGPGGSDVVWNGKRGSNVW
ncbi:hypothetical protein V7S43_018073 [Phytophthora oleae]|uniref:Crinkler effector protein N-terminal domain-containing protein n=1 Tax=Phytophthora oleae TaxID=2107226 RepID=A0ABD3EVG9_9STRA